VNVVHWNCIYPGSPGRWSGETREGERHDNYDGYG
jgi:hypothetical protein